MFRFANPQYLWLLTLIPLFVVLFAGVAAQRRRRLARFGNPDTLAELMPEVSNGRVVLKFILFCGAVALVVLAAARPQFGSKLREEKARGVEMMLVVDVSNSMLAEDFEPNRLERTKYAINRLFDGLKQDRVGLIVFAGEPRVQLPITSDYRMAKAFARRIDPSQVSVQGTAIGKALEQRIFFTRARIEHGIEEIVHHAAAARRQRAFCGADGAYSDIGVGRELGKLVDIDGQLLRRHIPALLLLEEQAASALYVAHQQSYSGDVPLLVVRAFKPVYHIVHALEVAFHLGV